LLLQWLGEELFDLIPEQLGVKFDYGAWSDCYKVIIAGLTS
jgi:hypothetical protein